MHTWVRKGIALAVSGVLTIGMAASLPFSSLADAADEDIIFQAEGEDLDGATTWTDIWSKKKRSAVMAKIKGKDTKPEWIVRRYLFSRGYRYRKNVKGLPGTPDIVLRKYGIVIFIHGCFWHGHEVDGTMPKTNREFWKNKIEGNKLRDKRNKEKLRKMGWSVITVWECQLKSAVRQQTLLEIEYYINHTYLERFRSRPSMFYEIPEDKDPPGVVTEGEAEYGKR